MKMLLRMGTCLAFALALPLAATAAITPGFEFLLDASQDTDGDSVWEDVVGTAGYEFYLDTAGGVARVPISGLQLTHAYDFPGGTAGAGEGGVAGAKLVALGETGECRSFKDVGYDNIDATLEFWIKPDVLSHATVNGQTIWEDGGGTGYGLFIKDNVIYSDNDNGNDAQISYDLTADSLGLFSGSPTSEFFQVVLTRVASSGAEQMYINGQLVGAATDSGGNWSGGDGSGLGARGEANTGGQGNGDDGTQSFDGKIALFRLYSGEILTATEIMDNYTELSGPDTDPPTVVSQSPVDDATGVYPGVNLVVTFNEDIAVVTNGTISIRNLDAATQLDIILPDGQVTVDGAVLTIDPTANLGLGTNYAVQISADAIQDLAPTPNLFTGITNDTDWSFITAAPDGTPPVITDTNPADNATGVSRAATLVATFDDNIVVGSGDITIYNVTDATPITTIPVTNASLVLVESNILAIVSDVLLPGNKECAVQIDAGAIENFSGLGFAGISDNTTWSFTTALNTVYTWTQTAGGGQSWTTAANWDTDPSVPDPVAGDTVDFSTVDIAASTVVDLGADRTAEIWKFGDTNNGQDWTISGGYTLTLAGGGSPIINVVNRTVTIDSVIAGTAGLVKEGSGTLSLGAANTYTGDTVINGGTLYVGYFRDIPGSLGEGNYAGNIYIATNSTLAVWGNVNQTLSGNISGGGNVTKAFNGTLTLSGDNTYSGYTRITPQTTAGSALVVSSFNSINSGTPLLPSSSLGCPTTEADGTIVVGDGGKQASCTLKYVGPGETTDRVIYPQFNGTCQQIINASGTGLLKFTSPFLVKISTGSRPLNLAGTGSGEIAGGLPELPAQGLLKKDAGTWTLSGVNTFTTPTSITGGTLILAHGECLSDTASLTINGGVLQLNAGVREKVDSLVLGSTAQAVGSYGSTASKADNKNDTYFSGTGILYVGMEIPPPPPSGTLFTVH